ncbi:MAG: hypothetical protein WBD40_03370, partial [Tepidisphaeraceae bacterium]
PHIAQRYQVSEDAVRQLYRALESTGGAQAQFNHPELGGYGQWMPGMCMLSRTTDPQFKARISGLATELAGMVQGGSPTTPAGESWWPASFGHPAASGEQHGIRYAYFPDRDRLLIQQGARIDSYDTAGRRITGYSQQQSTAAQICFTTEAGPLHLSTLKCVPISPESAWGA